MTARLPIGRGAVHARDIRVAPGGLLAQDEPISVSVRHLVRALAVVSLLWQGAFQSLHAETMLEVGATKPVPAPESGYFKFGHAASPTGHVIGINSRYLTLDGRPWLPVMGEFHPTRYPSEFWEEEIVKMKSAGVDIISFYVIWVHHEARPGQFDWSGDRDIRHFVALCAKHDMKVSCASAPGHTRRSAMAACRGGWSTRCQPAAMTLSISTM